MIFSISKRLGCILVLLISACVTPAPQRGVIAPMAEEQSGSNIFYSTAMPKLRVKISDSFQYIGNSSAKKNHKFKSGTGTYYEAIDIYTFIRSEHKPRIEYLAEIWKYKLSNGYYLPDIFSYAENPLDTGLMVIDGKQYQYAIWASDIGDAKSLKLLETKGYIVPNIVLVKGIARRFGTNNRHKIAIYYAEDIRLCSDGNFSKKTDWSNQSFLRSEQRDFLNGFRERAEKNIIFLTNSN